MNTGEQLTTHTAVDHTWVQSSLFDDITAEHRSIMETAYVYGSKYQFILITGGPVLKHLGFVPPLALSSSSSSGVSNKVVKSTEKTVLTAQIRS